MKQAATVTLVLIGCGVASPVAAQAQASVAWISSDPLGAEQAAALAVELAGRGRRVVRASWLLAPGGDDRASAARSIARASGAEAALWLERDADDSVSVRGVAASSEWVTWAPVPSGPLDSRVIALVSVSLIDELLSEPSSELLVLTPVAGGDDGSADSAAPPPAPTPPVPTPTAQRRDFYLQFNAAAALVWTAGWEGRYYPAGFLGAAIFGPGFYPHRNVRLDASLRLGLTLNYQFAGTLMASVAYVSAADDGRFEAGLEAGAVLAGDPGFLGGAYVGWSWASSASTRLGFRVSLDLQATATGVYPAGALDLYFAVMP